MMISLDEKIEPPISIVTYIQKQFTDMKRNISLIQTDQDRTGKVGSRVTRVDLISRYDDALNNFEMFSRWGNKESNESGFRFFLSTRPKLLILDPDLRVFQKWYIIMHINLWLVLFYSGSCQERQSIRRPEVRLEASYRRKKIVLSTIVNVQRYRSIILQLKMKMMILVVEHKSIIRQRVYWKGI